MAKKNYPLYDVKYFNNFKEMLAMADSEAGEKLAVKYKEKGEVREVTYHEFVTATRALGTALAGLGADGLHIAMTGENSYEWLTVYLTVINSRGVFVPIDKDLPAKEIAYILDNSDSEVVFCSGALAEKLRGIENELPRIRYFINIAAEEDDGRFLSYKKLMAKGLEALEAGDTSYLESEFDTSGLKMLVYTSGTTGIAKGVMLSERNLVSGVIHGLEISTVFDTCLSVLPYHHTYEAVCGLLVGLHHHSTICINDSLRNVAENMKLFKPDYIMLVPLFVENLYKKIWKNVEESGKGKALRGLIKTSNGLRKVGVDMRPKFFKSIRDVFGGNVVKLVCGGAPIRTELAEFFDAIGINLINGYGITECSPLVAVNRDYYSDYRSVGVKLPSCELRIDEPNEDGEGEICVKGDIVMLGYYKNPEGTAEVMEDGWFHTGDYGRIDENTERLFITGRKKNLIVLKNGKNVYPEEIEGYVMTIPYVEEVVVFALRNKDGEETGLCAELYLNEESVAELDIPARLALLKGEIEKLNRTLPGYKNILKIKLRPNEFEKTTSKKIRRVGIDENGIPEA